MTLTMQFPINTFVSVCDHRVVPYLEMGFGHFDIVHIPPQLWHFNFSDIVKFDIFSLTLSGYLMI